MLRRIGSPVICRDFAVFALVVGGEDSKFVLEQAEGFILALFVELSYKVCRELFGIMPALLIKDSAQFAFQV